MADHTNIFQYTCYRTYLREAPATRKSHGQWARDMGYRSPRGIAMVLVGKRLPSQEMLARISEVLGHSDLEHRYLEALVRLEKAKKAGRPTDKMETLIAELKRQTMLPESAGPLNLTIPKGAVPEVKRVIQRLVEQMKRRFPADAPSVQIELKET